MAEWRLQPGIPECTTREWYAARDRAPHLEQENHCTRLRVTADEVDRVASPRGYRTVVDLGAGDGGLLSLLPAPYWAWGYDLQPSNIIGAGERGVDVRLADILTDPIEWGQVAVATELLEHLIDPHGLVRTIRDHASALVCSSPWGETPDSHYEHHVWAWDEPGYRAMVEQAGWKVLRQRRAALAQIITAVRA